MTESELRAPSFTRLATIPSLPALLDLGVGLDTGPDLHSGAR